MVVAEQSDSPSEFGGLFCISFRECVVLLHLEGFARYQHTKKGGVLKERI